MEKKYLVSLLIKSFHNKTQNETECILAELKQMYWTVSDRTSIMKVARQCFKCCKVKSKAVTPYMSYLPTFRMDYQRSPFTNTGLDFFGPMFIKQRCLRLMRWGCLFACMVTQAVYLELVEPLETESFINALQRFINRRSKPNTLVSDCGSNFKVVTQELNLEHTEFNQDKTTNFTDQKSIKWKFNPPSSSHMGVPHILLLHVIRDRILTDFQMMTMFTEVENVVNNRPFNSKQW